jgi:probable rRNA maturation factor
MNASPEVGIEVLIEDAAWLEAEPDAEARVEAAALQALGGRGGGVVALLTNDAGVAALNAEFRGKTGPTNVLSFPAPRSARPHLGDVVLAFGVCQREAQEQGKSLTDHLSHLTVHGVLHLLGYDHQTDAEADAMEALERRLLADLGVPDPYGAERPDVRT